MTGPLPLSDVEPVPHGRTARRLEWQHLPPAVRALVERRLGSPVVDVRSQGSGFTPGFASRLTGEDGSRVFVKAASKRAQRPFAASYAAEAHKLGLLPTARLPVPELLWAHEDDSWVVLGFEDVDGRPPRRPWLEPELTGCLDALAAVDDVMTPVPPHLELAPLHQELPMLVSGWDVVVATGADWPHLEEARALARSLPELTDADHFIHADARDDNFLITSDGRTLLCDWNWPALGPRWVDGVDLLLTAHGDGLDAQVLLAAHPLTSAAAPDDVDVWLAAICGYMLEADTRPVPSSSPALGVHRRWWASASWSWLAQRRGWS